jgi:hypothetical protein
MKYLRKIFESKYSNLSHDLLMDIEDIFVEVYDISNINKIRFVWVEPKDSRGSWVIIKSRLDHTDESYESIRLDFSGNRENISVWFTRDNFNTIISCTERLKEYLSSHKDVDCNIQIRYKSGSLVKYDFDEVNSKGSFNEISICIFSKN